uniref:NADH-ubiquinone oxidoreductase chain 5 n=1 Tax=Synapturanus sp. MZUSP 159215 TaxID=2877832 RepID=A0A8K1LZC9_9NEOB|nr:NADH dehydrogenase subunit 5 [Synapturanus sp. MZUSP 159215]
MNLLLISSSSLIMTVLFISLPLLNTTSPNFCHNTKTAVMIAFLISIAPLLFFAAQESEAIIISWHWIHLNSTQINLTLQFDIYSIIFLPVALFVTWNILEFSIWYMHTDPKINIFFKYLLVFLLAMVILVTAGNMFTLFIGWEGVGIMSFLLIGWYHARNNAGAAALQAVLYNRIGDIGFLFAVAWLLINSTSLELNHIFSLYTNTPLLIALITAAATKSAQFGFHPWLASAMEGPTPVSALLHSSTMVVAGIFLMIRIHPMTQMNQTALSICLCLGAISTSFAATCALTQNDMKKIIAYSTSSQLGLMMVAIGLNFPHLAFFHICTHAFFKAMLFLCSGSIIHNINNEQDIRKMGAMMNALPITSSCISIGSLALMGTPYLAGFFSKDAIIEATTTSYSNTWAIILTAIATSFTAIYSLRLMFFSSLGHTRTNPPLNLNENSKMITNPLKRLALGSIITGLILYQLIIPYNPVSHTMPTPAKLMAIIITLLAFILAADLVSLSLTSNPPLNPRTPKNMNTNFYSLILHRIIPMTSLKLGLFMATHLLDLIWLEKIGPKGLVSSQLPPIKMLQNSNLGLIKTYLTIFVLTLIILMTTLQLV